MIKAICFDLDGVYFVNGKSNFIKNLSDLGVSEDEAKRVFLKSDQMNFQYKFGKISDNQYWDWAIKEWGLNLTVEEIIDLLIKGYEVNAEVAEYVRKVRSKGYKTVVCSNNFAARINGLHNRFGFLGDFDVVVLSYQEKAVKPDNAIYKALLQKSDVKPEELVISDDDESKLAGAKELGINTFVYTNFNDFVNNLQKLGVEV